MHISRITMSGIALAALAGGAAASHDGCTHACGDQGADVPISLAHPDEIFMHELAGRLIHSLPADEQAEIAAKDGIGSHALDIDLSHFTYEVDRSKTAHIDPDITPREYRDLLVSDELDARMTDTQRIMMDRVLELLEAGTMPPALCFKPGTDPEYAYAINELIEFPLQFQFQQTGRWSATATDGGGLNQGEPTTITYSYVPDSTFVPNLIGFSGSSNLFSWLNGIYGSPGVWQPIFDQVFDRWAELTGTSYIFEPNDDGSNLNGAQGVLGVRGDVRIAAIGLDGNSGTLAYNNFPNDGDMVFDSADSFYNSTGGNSIRLRNIIAHEHGHGLGMLHVCPANGSKLMEPFINLSFDGPQLDDILNGHRHYGDPNEPNDVTPTGLGSFAAADLPTFISNVSLDDNSDTDVYGITLSEPLRLTVSASPDAAIIEQGPQTQSCNSGTNTNYNTIHDLRIEIFSTADPFTPLVTANSTGAGSTESLTFDAENAGDYLVVVDTPSSANNVQRYALTVNTTDLPFLVPQIAANAPTNVDPGETTDFGVTVDPRDDTLVGTPELFTRINGGSFSSTPLSPVSGDDFTATLPSADCGDVVEFYISTQGDTSGEITLPSGGSSDPFTAQVGQIVTEFDDDFDLDLGWTVSGTVTQPASGLWQRGIPVGANDSRISDAPEDFDNTGAGRCFVTGNVQDNSDVDDGTTILTSPAFDVAANPEAEITYARWFDNNEDGTAAEPFTETFVVEISDDNGSSWTLLEEVGPTGPEVSGGWFVKSFPIGDFVSTTDQVRVRFIASDDIGTIVEAAVDAVTVTGLVCEDPEPDPCQVDFNGDGVATFPDVSLFLAAFSSGDLSADFNGDGSVTFPDVSLFLAAFAAGCP